MPLNQPIFPSTVRYEVARAGLLRALFDGLRAALLMPARPDRQPVRPFHVLVMWLLAMAVSAIGDAMLLGLHVPLLNESGVVEPVFNATGVRGAAFEALLWLLASLWVATPSASALRSGAATGAVTAPAPLQLAAPLFAANLWITLAGYAFVIAADRGGLERFESMKGMTLDTVAEATFVVTVFWPVLVAAMVMSRIWRSAARSRGGSWLVLPVLACIAWLSLQSPVEPMWSIDEDLEDIGQSTNLQVNSRPANGVRAAQTG